ncbi:regulator of telomere elongation helicase 1-like protein, partial [Dinothrombium tinctorium]
MKTVEVNETAIAFPFEPYQIQLEYMHAVIEAMREGKIALLESPTGTGKTLSLLCSTISF